jgi:hypothetical protein
MRKSYSRPAVLALGFAFLMGLASLPLVNRTAQAAEPYRHPRIHSAIEALQSAKTEIEEAKHEWGGEKKEAVESIDRAIEHLKKLEEYHE